MKELQFTETQIVGILKEAESGLPMADLLRSHGMNAITSPNYRLYQSLFGSYRIHAASTRHLTGLRSFFNYL